MAIRLPKRKFLAVHRHDFRLAYYKRPALTNRYDFMDSWPIAIGALGYETPPGLYYVENSFWEPRWLVPDSEWAPEELRGTLIESDDPLNPLKGAFLRISNLDGIGIHGTSNLASLGTQASHGCIRVEEDVARWLYKEIPLGTPVYVA